MIEMLPSPNVTVTPEREIRIMTPEEVAELQPIFEARGTSLPDPAVSVFMGVFKRGVNIAFQCIQLRVHADPIYIEEGHSDVFIPLVKESEKYILAKCGPCIVYVFTPAGRVSQLAQSMGMQMEPWVIHSKVIMPEEPKAVAVDLSMMPLGDTIEKEVVQ